MHVEILGMILLQNNPHKEHSSVLHPPHPAKLGEFHAAHWTDVGRKRYYTFLCMNDTVALKAVEARLLLYSSRVSSSGGVPRHRRRLYGTTVVRTGRGVRLDAVQ